LRACRLQRDLLAAEALVNEYQLSIQSLDETDLDDKAAIDELTARLQDDLAERHPRPLLPFFPCLLLDMYPDNSATAGVLPPMAPAATSPLAGFDADGMLLLVAHVYSGCNV
jgi:hypothetical protein